MDFLRLGDEYGNYCQLVNINEVQSIKVIAVIKCIDDDFQPVFVKIILRNGVVIKHFTTEKELRKKLKLDGSFSKFKFRRLDETNPIDYPLVMKLWDEYINVIDIDE
ncbi:Uncharacterised protein [Phocoenobacter uteri]|uniref:Uncharacterized protein n=2 Tax=Phocoenobacter uteri TaxID=146806 RepID=A0A379C9Z7_9PAST|nr:hypothetical protein [Phocoenobacter uteri]SUB59094.1 Uncharacterised protein [Phocoenobacter uteri]